MTERETRRATSDRLYYEWWMLCAAEEALRDSSLPRATKNAWIEVGAVHARNLADFLFAEAYRGRRFADDALADEFFASPEIWRAVRPTAPDALGRDEFQDAVNKQIVHFTKWENPKKHWNFEVAADALQPALEAFLGAVDVELLGERWYTDLREAVGTRWDRIRQIVSHRPRSREQ